MSGKKQITADMGSGDGLDERGDSPNDDVFDGMDVPREADEDPVFVPEDEDDDDEVFFLGQEFCVIIPTEDQPKKRKRRRPRRKKDDIKDSRREDGQDDAVKE